MKVRIFNSGKGWYVSASNYKDKEDKAYMNVHFAQSQCPEPSYQDNGRGYSVKDIDVYEGKFTSYKGKIGLTIFHYELLTEAELEDTSKFGGSRDGLGSNIVEPDDLPWY